VILLVSVADRSSERAGPIDPAHRNIVLRLDMSRRSNEVPHRLEAPVDLEREQAIESADVQR
jgi:hypothetical protein